MEDWVEGKLLKKVLSLTANRLSMILAVGLITGNKHPQRNVVLDQFKDLAAGRCPFACLCWILGPVDRKLAKSQKFTSYFTQPEILAPFGGRISLQKGKSRGISVSGVIFGRVIDQD